MEAIETAPKRGTGCLTVMPGDFGWRTLALQRRPALRRVRHHLRDPAQPVPSTSPSAPARPAAASGRVIGRTPARHPDETRTSPRAPSNPGRAPKLQECRTTWCEVRRVMACISDVLVADLSPETASGSSTPAGRAGTARGRAVVRRAPLLRLAGEQGLQDAHPGAAVPLPQLHRMPCLPRRRLKPRRLLWRVGCLPADAALPASTADGCLGPRTRWPPRHRPCLPATRRRATGPCSTSCCSQPPLRLQDVGPATLTLDRQSPHPVRRRGAKRINLHHRLGTRSKPSSSLDEPSIGPAPARHGPIGALGAPARRRQLSGRGRARPQCSCSPPTASRHRPRPGEPGRAHRRSRPAGGDRRRPDSSPAPIWPAVSAWDTRRTPRLVTPAHPPSSCAAPAPTTPEDVDGDSARSSSHHRRVRLGQIHADPDVLHPALAANFGEGDQRGPARSTASTRRRATGDVVMSTSRPSARAPAPTRPATSAPSTPSASCSPPLAESRGLHGRHFSASTPAPGAAHPHRLGLRARGDAVPLLTSPALPDCDGQRFNCWMSAGIGSGGGPAERRRRAGNDRPEAVPVCRPEGGGRRPGAHGRCGPRLPAPGPAGAHPLRRQAQRLKLAGFRRGGPEEIRLPLVSRLTPGRALPSSSTSPPPACTSVTSPS